MNDAFSITDSAKSALIESGLLSKFKKSMHIGDEDIDGLKQKAIAVAEELEHVIATGTLRDTETQKLTAVLAKLRGALGDGKVSRHTLQIALSEATTALHTLQVGAQTATLNQECRKIWQQIGEHNDAIHDDFEQMRRAGIVFDDALWKKHKALSEYLEKHPQELEKQKELDAVDDQLLAQAEKQIDLHPVAKHYFQDAKTKSKERHHLVDHDIALLEKKKAVLQANADLDWNQPSDQQGKEADLNTMKYPAIGKATTTGHIKS